MNIRKSLITLLVTGLLISTSALAMEPRNEISLEQAIAHARSIVGILQAEQQDQSIDLVALLGPAINGALVTNSNEACMIEENAAKEVITQTLQQYDFAAEHIINTIFGSSGSEQDELELALALSLEQQGQHTDDELEQAIAASLSKQEQHSQASANREKEELEQVIAASSAEHTKEEDQNKEELEKEAFAIALSLSETQQQEEEQVNLHPEKTVVEGEELEKLRKVHNAMTTAEDQNGKGFELNEHRANTELETMCELESLFAENNNSSGKEEKEEITLSLHEAAQKGDLATVKKHIEGGTNLKQQDEYKKTAYHYAQQGDHANVMTYLRRKALAQDKQCPACYEDDFADDQLDIASSTCMHFICKMCKEKMIKTELIPEPDLGPNYKVPQDKCPVCREPFHKA